MTTSPKNLTQLKRFLSPGMVLTRRHSRPELQGRCAVATVDKVQTNGFWYRSEDGTRMWSEFQSATNYAFDDTGFTVTLMLGTELFGTVRYEYVAPPEAVCP